MAEYLHDISEEKFEELDKEKIKDDGDVLFFLQNIVSQNDDRKFNFLLLNLGTLMKICAVELEFKAHEIESYFKLEKDNTRDRKMAFILKELNKKINLRYEFSEETEIVPFLYTYEGRGYIYVDKFLFIRLLNNIDIDIETLENV